MSKKKILICDDNREVREVLRIGLKQLPQVEVVPLANGKEIIRYLDSEPSLPDLIIVDLILPDMEGDDVVTVLRKSKKYQDLPIILMSGVIYNIDNRAKAVGADDFLIKPFSIQDLQDKASKHLKL